MTLWGRLCNGIASSLTGGCNESDDYIQTEAQVRQCSSRIFVKINKWRATFLPRGGRALVASFDNLSGVQPSNP